MILLDKRITKALISLHGCAGWSVPVLFAKLEDRFSCVKARFMINLHESIGQAGIKLMTLEGDLGLRGSTI